MRKSENEKEIGTCSVKKSYCTKKSWCSDNGMLHVFSVFPRSNRWKSTASAWDQDDHCSANSRGGQHQVKVFYGFGNDMQCQHQHHHHLDCQAVRGEDASNIEGGRCGPADQEGPPPLFKPPGSQTCTAFIFTDNHQQNQRSKSLSTMFWSQLTMRGLEVGEEKTLEELKVGEGETLILRLFDEKYSRTWCRWQNINTFSLNMLSSVLVHKLLFFCF